MWFIIQYIFVDGALTIKLIDNKKINKSKNFTKARLISEILEKKNTKNI